MTAAGPARGAAAAAAGKRLPAAAGSRSLQTRRRRARRILERIPAAAALPAMRHRLPLPTLLLSLAACSSGDTDDGVPAGGQPSSALVDLVVRDAPADALATFVARFDSVRLVRDDGSESAPLVAVPVAVELTGLRDRVAWIGSAALATGTYEAVRARFAPGAVEARDLDGAPVAIDAQADVLDAPLAVPLVLRQDDYARVVLDVDLGASLAGDVAAGSLRFDPRGSAEASDGSVPVPLDDLDALVTARDLAAGTFAARATVGDARTVALRTVDVRTGADTLLVGPLQDVFAQTALYLTLLTPGLAVVELEGVLGKDGALRARCVELEDQNGLAGTRFPVELEARVVARPQPNLATLLVREVTRGEGLAGPVLSGLGRATVDVLIDPAPLLSSSDGALLSMADLPVGADVEAKFVFFSAEPFQAARLVLLRVPGEGDAGGVAAGAAIRLDVAHAPELAPETLPAGTRVWRSGDLALVRAGLLVEGRVRSVDAGRGRLQLASGRVVADFGAGAPAGTDGPFAVEVDPAARFLGAARDLSELARLLEEPAASVVLEVRGLEAAGSATLRAYEVRTRVADAR